MPEERVDIRARLQGARQYMRDAYAAAKATEALGVAATTTGRHMEGATRRSFLYNQVLFTMRRYLYQATLGATALGAAAIFTGLKFDAGIEKAQISFKRLLGSEQAATNELAFLYNLAAKTPFEFQPLTETARKFMAWGFTVEETNRTLAASADAIAALGASQDTIDRITLALGQMAVKGRVTGEELRQLAEAGVPAYQYLADAFGENVTQLNRIADARIPAQAGIEAIVAGIEQDPKFKGAAEDLAKSVSGQITTLMDYTKQLLGLMVRSPFMLIQAAFPGLISAIGRANDAAIQGGFWAMAESLDKSAGASGKLTLSLRILDHFFRSFFAFLRGTAFPVLWPFVQATLAIVLAFAQLTSWALNFVNLGGQPLVWALRLIVLWLVIERITMKLATLWALRYTFATKMAAFWNRRLAIASLFLSIVMGGKLRAAMLVATIQMWLFNTAVLANPLTWIVLGIVALVGVLIVLELKFHVVTRAVQWLWNKLKAFINWLKDNKDVLLNLIPGIGPLIFAGHRAGLFGRARHFVGLQQGGTVTQPGWFQVGERGPELLKLPLGAAVHPQEMDWSGMTGKGMNVTIMPQPIYLDGREVAEVVYKHRLDRLARR